MRSIDGAVELAPLRARVAQQVDVERRGDELVRASNPDRSSATVSGCGRTGPAAMSSSSDSATSATTSAFFRLKRRARPSARERVVLERRHEPRPRRLQRRRDAEDEAGESTTGRARTAARGDRSRNRARSAARRRRRRGRERADRRRATPEADPTAPPMDRQQHALGQQLADDAPAAGAEREPDRDLAPPRRGRRQQQVGDVGARDQQHGADDAAEQQRDRLHLLPLVGIAVVDRHERHRAAPAPTGSARPHVRSPSVSSSALRLLRRDARSQLARTGTASRCSGSSAGRDSARRR